MNSRCPTHCRYWSYESTSSFADMYTMTSDHQKTMFARIHVYYGELGYREHTEVKDSKIYLAICDFGNNVGFYWGMSMVSFFHVFFYTLQYLYLRRRQKDAKKEKPLFVIKKKNHKAPPIVNPVIVVEETDL